MEIYYWKSIDWLIVFQYNSFGRDVFLPRRIFDSEWVKLPIEFGDDVDVFTELNSETNPLGTPHNQSWMKEHGISHTSMSVGDVVKKDNTFLICLPIGWGKLLMG